MTLYQPYVRASADWYVEPESLVESILESERIIGTVLDPACGIGTIPRVCRRHGIEAYGSDITNRGYGLPFIDFTDDRLGGRFRWGLRGTRIDNIISNPPFKTPTVYRFLERALDVAQHKVVLILPLTFLASQERKEGVFNGKTPLARVYVFSKRPSMPPGHLYVSGEMKRGGGKQDYVVLVWTHDHRGDPVVR